MRRPSSLVLAVVAVLITTLFPSAMASSDAERAPRARAGFVLAVKIVRPDGHAAKVVVTGPGDFRKSLKGATTLRGLKAGRYQIRARAVVTKEWRATAEVNKASVRLGASKPRARVLVDYGTAISRDLEALPGQDVAEFEAPTEADTGTLVSASELRVGDVVVSATSAEAPAGILVKVVDVADGDPLNTYEVEPATLQEAIPAGSFDTTFTAELVDPDAARTSRERRAGPAPTALPISCSGSAEAGVEVTASGGIDVSMKADWDWADSSVTLTARAHAGAAVRAWMAAAGSCEIAPTTLFRRSFAPINLQLGPAPIVILPKLEMLGGGSISASGAVEVSGNVGVEAKFVGKASRNGFSTSFTGPTFDSAAGVSTSANATGSVYAKAVVTGEIYGLAGPHASLKLSINAQADKDANPWWTVDANAAAGVGVKVNKCLKILWKDVCLKFDRSKDDIFSKTVRIADSGGPYDAGSDIADDIGGDGVDITDPDTNEDTGGTGRVPDLFDGNDAWVLSTGSIADVPGSDSSIQASTDRGASGNATLSELSGHDTYDATFISMTVTPTGNRLKVDYLFATEEFPEYVGSAYNDVMGVFVNGTNCAVVPGTSAAVSVNTVNDQTNSQYFVDNRSGQVPTVMNGLTVPLSCEVAVTPGVPVQVLIGVADASDGILDSAVALVDGGITSYTE